VSSPSRSGQDGGWRGHGAVTQTTACRYLSPNHSPQPEDAAGYDVPTCRTVSPRGRQDLQPVARSVSERGGFTEPRSCGRRCRRCSRSSRPPDPRPRSTCRRQSTVGQISCRFGRQPHRGLLHCVRPRSQFAGELEQPISRGVARQMARVLTHAESLCPKVFRGEKGICAVLRHVLQNALPTNELSRVSHI
jgi:hypothetical protein